jgi:hypothetical protein
MIEEAFITGGVRLGTLRALEQVTQSPQRDLGREFSIQDPTLDD